jgi:hypothetical protein
MQGSGGGGADIKKFLNKFLNFFVNDEDAVFYIFTN